MVCTFLGDRKSLLVIDHLTWAANFSLFTVFPPPRGCPNFPWWDGRAGIRTPLPPHTLMHTCARMHTPPLVPPALVAEGRMIEVSSGGRVCTSWCLQWKRLLTLPQIVCKWRTAGFLAGGGGSRPAPPHPHPTWTSSLAQLSLTQALWPSSG